MKNRVILINRHSYFVTPKMNTETEDKQDIIKRSRQRSTSHTFPYGKRSYKRPIKYQQTNRVSGHSVVVTVCQVFIVQTNSS